MKHKTIIILLLILTTLTSCFGLFDSQSERITGDYILIWTDFQESQCVIKEWDSSSGETIIPEYVFAVGHNDDYIIAKQHPTAGFEGSYKINDKITNYYIIDIKSNTRKTDLNVFGPLTKEEFNTIRNELKISTLEFDMIYPNNY